MLDHLGTFYNSNALPHPKISLDLEVTRDEISGAPLNVFSRVVRKLVELMGIQISDEQLTAEIEKITKTV